MLCFKDIIWAEDLAEMESLSSKIKVLNIYCVWRIKKLKQFLTLLL